MPAAKNNREGLISFGKGGGFVVGDCVDRKVAMPALLTCGESLVFQSSLPIPPVTTARQPGALRNRPSRSGLVANPRLVDLVDIVDEQGRAAAAAEFVEEFFLRHRRNRSRGPSEASRRNNPTVAQRQ